MSSALEGITPIARKETLGVIVREELRSALMAGRFKPGEKLTIRAVASALDVSLTPAREALYNLMAEGILESGSNGTIFVPLLDEDRIEELCKIRVSLEGLAAREAVRLMTDKDVKAIAAIHRDLLSANDAKDFPRLMELNWQFHFGIYELAAMPTLKRIIESCWLKMGSYLNIIYPDYGEAGEGIARHEEIIEAARARDGEALAEAIRADIRHSSQRMIAMIRTT